ncbi:5-methylcytosine restriction system specificity protein McrC [Nonlabens sp. Asnod3-A02]|uniref:5-methylcytosine restriction system specificity protein McrC n=1 Tax=Nonlabens sp. Asnod3-A02 TaxID=3160579 RepID=UPI0038654959
MHNSLVTLRANDCSPFQNQEGHADAIQYFLSKPELKNVFHFKTKKNRFEDDSPIAEFNYKTSSWYAGRYIGEATFEYNNQHYKIIILPRFGNLQLYNMLEEVYNIRLSKSSSIQKNDNQFQLLIRKVIAFLWLNLLGKANKHGVPKKTVSKTYKGTKVMGRLNVRESIIPLKTEEKIVSRFTEKAPEDVVVRILKEAHRILSSNYGIGSIKTSAGARNSLQQIFSFSSNQKKVSEIEYKNIRYKNIFTNYKPLVDLSWDIIKNKQFGRQDFHQNSAYSFFLDMAEIWELYLKSILKKKLMPNGWALVNEKLTAYRYKDFQRLLIPDIVFEKEGQYLVWDAKYKRMKFDYFDYDRADFFQIHTYINYHQQKGKVLTAGLLYPLSKQFKEERIKKNKSSTLYGIGNQETTFIVDGIDYSTISPEVTDYDNQVNKLKEEEFNFLNRIEKVIFEKQFL